MKSSLIKKKYLKDGKPLTGFTIIELIISVFILSIAVVGIYSAFSVLVVLTANASDRLTAAYLAQEGVEIIRNIRDSNWLNPDLDPTADWDQGFSNCTAEIGGCIADYKTMGTGSLTLEPYGTEDDDFNYLMIDADGFYSYDSNGQKTKFKRQIIVEPIDDHIEKVTVNVFWDEKPNILNSTGAPGSVTVEEYFYNWY